MNESGKKKVDNVITAGSIDDSKTRNIAHETMPMKQCPYGFSRDLNHGLELLISSNYDDVQSS